MKAGIMVGIKRVLMCQRDGYYDINVYKLMGPFSKER